MLDAVDPRRRRPRRPLPVPAERFECWSLRQAAVLVAQLDLLTAGYRAGRKGAPCPGAVADDSYRLGWEIGHVEGGHGPMPAWLAALAAQDRHDCAGSA